MNRCPQCHQTYTDETLKFCRVDGALLQTYSSPAESSDTLILPDARRSETPPTQLLQSETAHANATPSSIEAPRTTQTVTVKAASGSKRHGRGSVIALSILILSATGLGIWFKNRSLSGPTNPAPIESIAVLPFANESGELVFHHELWTRCNSAFSDVMTSENAESTRRRSCTNFTLVAI